MAKALDFNKVKKPFWTVTLADENKTVLMVKTPTKATWKKILDLHAILKNAEGNVDEADVMDDLYDLCAEILSNNKTGKVITADDLEKWFEFTDTFILFNGYIEFVQEGISSKN